MKFNRTEPKMRYYSSRIKTRVAKALLKKLGYGLDRIETVKKWMGYVHPEAWHKRETAYQAEYQKILAEFLAEQERR